MHFHLALFDTRQLDICVNNHISLGKAAFQCFVTVRLMFAEGNSYNLPTDVVMFLIAIKGLNLWGIRFECFNRVVNSRKHFVFYFNSLDGFSCDCLGFGCDSSNFVTNILRFIGKNCLIANRFCRTRCCHHSGRCVEWFIGCVLKSADSYYAWQSFSGRGVNLHNLRMRIRTAQNSGVEHMRHGDVHRELSKTGGFIKAIVAGDVFANIFHRSHSPFLILSAAAMTASSIFT